MPSLPKMHCPKCGNEWVPRVENPVKCPQCKHRLGARIYKKASEVKTAQQAA